MHSLVGYPSQPFAGPPANWYPSHNGVGFGLEIQRFRARTRVRLTGQARPGWLGWAVARSGCGCGVEAVEIGVRCGYIQA